MTTLKPTPSSKEVLRYTSEEQLIKNIQASGLLLLDGSEEAESEYDVTLWDLFEQFKEDADINDWTDFANKVLHNAPIEAKEELKYIIFQFIPEDEQQDYDMRENDYYAPERLTDFYR